MILLWISIFYSKFVFLDSYIFSNYTVDLKIGEDLSDIKLLTVTYLVII